MGLFKKSNKETADTGKDTAANQSGGWPEFPDLTDYRKAILLHNISFEDIKNLLEEYSNINSDKIKLTCDFFYTAIPDDESWVYLEFPNFDGIKPYTNFWCYEDLLIWLSAKSDKEFCLAIPRDQYAPLFLSTVDRQNPYGDSCMGIFAERDFYFNIPGNNFEWGPIPSAPFNIMGFLMGNFGFDTRWIPNVTKCKWEKTTVTMTFSAAE